MTPELAAILVVLCVALFEAWFIYEGRPRGPKAPGANHHHKGPIRSEHEVAGRPVYVYECEKCRMHFSGVH